MPRTSIAAQHLTASRTVVEMWAFEAYAEGLRTTLAEAKASSEPPRQLHKTSRNNDLFDAAGKPLAAHELHNVTTWRTHHAFGGRCALVKAQEGKESDAAVAVASRTGPQRWAEQAWAAYQDWSVSFSLRSTTAEEPHILLSVAPAYVPLLSSPTGETLEADAATLSSLPAAPTAQEQQHYDNRLLDTPLIWEEAYTLSVECTPRGMFLWSDQWELYGKKIADRCLEVQKKPEMPVDADDAAVAGAALQTFAAAVRLRFHAPSSDDASSKLTPAVLAVDLQESPALTDVKSSAAKRVDDAMWRHVMDIPLPLDALARRTAFRPHVSLLESGDSVELI